MRVPISDPRRSRGTGRIAAFILLSLLAFGAAPLARAAGIAIVQPADQETVHSNVGDVTVELHSSGAVPGGSVRLIVDGVAQSSGGAVLHLHGLDRGAHTLQAQLLNADGEVIAASRSITFYLWHASRLFRHPDR